MKMSIFLTLLLTTTLFGQDNFKRECKKDSDCMLVKSGSPCGGVKSIHLSNSVKEWNLYLKKNAGKVKYRCRRNDFTLENSMPICKNNICSSQEKNRKFAQVGERCFVGSMLRVDSCQKGLVCVDQKGKKASAWSTGTCKNYSD